MDLDNRPIGVFDSGIGGLTVLKSLAESFPKENFVYLGDTARLPYGSKSPQTIRQYTFQNLNFLCEHDVKALVVACNSASTQVFENTFQNRPLYSVIGPGADSALRVTENFHIGVLGTRATISSRSYEKEILKLAPEAHVFSVACPLFVPLAEEGWDEDPITNLIAYRYLQALSSQNIDTLILGCTHYPLLKNSIQRAVGAQVQLVDSGLALAEILQNDLENEIWRPNFNSQLERSPDGKISIFITDESSQFRKLGEKILRGHKVNEFNLVSL